MNSATTLVEQRNKHFSYYSYSYSYSYYYYYYHYYHPLLLPLPLLMLPIPYLTPRKYAITYTENCVQHTGPTSKTFSLMHSDRQGCSSNCTTWRYEENHCFSRKTCLAGEWVGGGGGGGGEGGGEARGRLINECVGRWVVSRKKVSQKGLSEGKILCCSSKQVTIRPTKPTLNSSPFSQNSQMITVRVKYSKTASG